MFYINKKKKKTKSKEYPQSLININVDKNQKIDTKPLYIFPVLRENYIKKEDIIMYRKNNIFHFFTNVCIYNNTNYDIIFLYKNYKTLLYSKKNNYISNFQHVEEPFCILLFYKKKLFVSKKINIYHNFQKGSYHNRFDTNHLHIKDRRQHKEIKKTFNLCENINNNKMNRNIKDCNYSSGGIYHIPCNQGVCYKNLVSLKEDEKWKEYFSLIRCHGKEQDKKCNNDIKYTCHMPNNTHRMFELIKRKYIKSFLNNTHISYDKNGIEFIIDMTAIQNNNWLYIHIDAHVKLLNLLPLQVFFKCRDKIQTIKSFQKKDIFFQDITLNVSSNEFKDVNKLKIIYQKEDETRKKGDTIIINHDNKNKNNNNNDDDDNNIIPCVYRKQNFHLNYFRFNKEIIITCHTVIFLYDVHMKNIQINDDKLFFVTKDKYSNSNNIANEMKEPYIYPLKKIKKFESFYNEPCKYIIMENKKIEKIYSNTNIEIKIKGNNQSISNYVHTYMIICWKRQDQLSNYINDKLHMSSIFPYYDTNKETNDITQDRKCYNNNNNNDINNDNNGNNTNYLFNNNMLSPYNNFINQIILIHPYFILINNTNFNLVMCTSCNFYNNNNNNNKNYKTSEREINKNKRNYYFPRHSSHVINLISLDVDRNFFFYISNSNNINNYPFICGKVDITKESTIILCFLNNKNIKHKENTTKHNHNNNYNMNNNNDMKYINTEKQTYHVTFIHLKISICKGFKLQGYYKKNVFPNSMYIIISEYVNNVCKFE
ncbi:hypothetical protein PFFVO_06050, partial [Plasmodium falciparum Vietnam Oak-Knoll (FVO)]